MISPSGDLESKHQPSAKPAISVCTRCGCGLSGTHGGVDDNNGAVYCRDCYQSLFYPGINKTPMDGIDF